MNSEQRYYENPNLWAIERYGTADQQRIATLADKLPADVRTLLDVGCGNGLFLKHLSELKGRKFDRLCGTDRSAAALVRVQSEKVEASIDSLPFADQEFDAVTCMEALEHLPHETYHGALREMSRVARQHILISVPHNETLQLALTECAKCFCRFHPYYHLRTFQRQIMATLLDEQGFVCRKQFAMHRERVIPNSLRVANRLFRGFRKVLLRQTHGSMVHAAVCPACGYSPRTGDAGSVTMPIQLGSRIRPQLHSMLCIKPSWRWLGALYERS